MLLGKNARKHVIVTICVYIYIYIYIYIYTHMSVRAYMHVFICGRYTHTDTRTWDIKSDGMGVLMHAC